MRVRSVPILLFALVCLVFAGMQASGARADGDPGSDVLVYQDLFVDSDAGLTVAQQTEIGNLLKVAAADGFPVRVAIIASRFDLGSVTELWRQPRDYARFLGIELSLAYKQRLLVVMPNGFGFNWPGHSSTAANAALSRITVGAGGTGLLEAAESGVRALAAATGIHLAGSGATGAAGNSGGGSSGATAGGATVPAPIARTPGTHSPGSGTDSAVGWIVIGLTALAALALLGRAARRNRSRTTAAQRVAPVIGRHRFVLPGAVIIFAVGAGAAVAIVNRASTSSPARDVLATNPNLDPGTPLAGPAPDFTLSDQFGRPISLRSYRGKVVIIAFNDSECTTVCPLTTTAMLDAKAMLGRAGSQVQLLGVDADPAAISLEDLWSYSELHGMLHQWHFLTGTRPQLTKVWGAYHVEAAIEQGQITHTPALFVIGPNGEQSKVYVTQMSYSSVDEFGQLLAQEASNLLPDHPAVDSHRSYSPVPTFGPSATVTMPRAGGRSVTVGPGRSAHLEVFFATWDQEVTSVGGQLDALNQYASHTPGAGLPPLTAIDEGSVEPSTQALPAFLAHLAHPLSYPVAIDQTGQVADGYEVQGVPWYVLTSADGQILWSWEVSTQGWLSQDALVGKVRAALARVPAAPATVAAVQRALAGSPAPLAALHDQASQLLGSESALAARVRALRGYPVVINVWASWCTPCRREFGLFAAASAHYGRRVAFLGADTGDAPGDARSFLTEHPVSYPSYQATTANLGGFAVVQGLPTTIFIDAAGKVVYVHTGQYFSQGTLDQDVGTYAG